MSKKKKRKVGCSVSNAMSGKPTRIEVQIIRSFLLLKKNGVHFPKVMFNVLTSAQGFGYRKYLYWAQHKGYNEEVGNKSPRIRGDAQIDASIIEAVVKKEVGSYVSDWTLKSKVFMNQRLDYSLVQSKLDIQESAPLFLDIKYYDYASDVENYEPVEGEEFTPYAEVYQPTQKIVTEYKDSLNEFLSVAGTMDYETYCEFKIINTYKERTSFFLLHELDPNFDYEILTADMEQAPSGSDEEYGEEYLDYLKYFDEIRAKFETVDSETVYLRVNWLDGPGGNPTDEVTWITFPKSEFSEENEYLAYIWILKNSTKVTVTEYTQNENNELSVLYTKSSIRHTNPKLIIGLMKYPTGNAEIDAAFNKRTELPNTFAPVTPIRVNNWNYPKGWFWGVQGCKRIFGDKGAYDRQRNAILQSKDIGDYDCVWLTWAMPLNIDNSNAVAYKYSFWKKLWNSWSEQGVTKSKPVGTVTDWEGYIQFTSALKERHKIIYQQQTGPSSYETRSRIVNEQLSYLYCIQGMPPDTDWQTVPDIVNKLPELKTPNNYWITKYSNFKLTKQTVFLDEHLDKDTHASGDFSYACTKLAYNQSIKWEYIQYGTGTGSNHKTGTYWQEVKSFDYYTFCGRPQLNSTKYRADGTISVSRAVGYIDNNGVMHPISSNVSGYQPGSSSSSSTMGDRFFSQMEKKYSGYFLTFYRQTSETEYEYIRVKQPSSWNDIQWGKGENYDANSGIKFLLPLESTAMKSMSLVKWTNASQWATNVKVNWWVEKKVWGGLMGAIMGVITVVACVVAAFYCPYAIPVIIGVAGVISAVFKIPNMAIEFIAKVFSEVLGVIIDVFGEFLGTIIAIVIVIIITYYLGPEEGQLVWNSATATTAIQVLAYTAATVNVYTTIKMQAIQKEFNKEMKRQLEFQTQAAKKQAEIEQAYASNNIRTDAEHAMLVTDFWKYWQYKRNACSAQVETLDGFLTRTLMMGTDVAQYTLNNVYGFANNTLSISCNKPLIIG